jgi:hypothetical protein
MFWRPSSAGDSRATRTARAWIDWRYRKAHNADLDTAVQDGDGRGLFAHHIALLVVRE